MAFTMHSHSGQFCPGHAVDQLEDIIKHAISIGFKTIGLTEHMPRYEERDLYPEEVNEPPSPIGLSSLNSHLLNPITLTNTSHHQPHKSNTAPNSSMTRKPASPPSHHGTKPTSSRPSACKPSTRRKSTSSSASKPNSSASPTHPSSRPSPSPPA